MIWGFVRAIPTAATVIRWANIKPESGASAALLLSDVDVYLPELKI
jgi:hypothetical protein